MSTNVVVVTGHLTKDVELKHVGEKNSKVATASIGVNNWRPAGSATMWLKVEAWGRTAEYFSNGRKGQKVTVTGRIDEDQWEKDGNTHKQTKVVATDVELPPKAESNQQGQQPALTF